MDAAEDFKADFDLGKSLDELAKDPGERGRRNFFAGIKVAHFLVPCKSGGKEFLVLNTPKGDKFIPVFTSVDELKKWPFPYDEAAVVIFDQVKRPVVARPEELSGIVINPFGKALHLRHRNIVEIDLLTDGMAIERAEHKNGIILAPLLYSNAALATELKELFSGDENVYSAFLMLAQAKTDLVPHLFCLIDFDGGREEVFKKTADIIKKYMRRGERFELSKANYTMLRLARGKTAPIYEKDLR